MYADALTREYSYEYPIVMNSEQTKHCCAIVIMIFTLKTIFSTVVSYHEIVIIVLLLWPRI